MITRYALMFALFLTAVAVPSLLAREGIGEDLRPRGRDVPELVGDAAMQGRHWRARRLLGDYFAVTPDRTPGTVTLASGWDGDRGDWTAVGRLLDGRLWQDPLEVVDGWGLTGLSHGGDGVLEGGEVLDRYVEMGESAAVGQGLEHFRRGLATGAGGQTLVALASLDQAAEVMPWMADWANYFAAEVMAPTGDTAEVRRRLEAAGPALAARGWRLRAQAAHLVGDVLQARRLALAAARSSSVAFTRAAAWVLLGDLRLEGGDTAQAREAYRSALEGASSSIAAVHAARRLSELGPTPDEWRRIGSIYLRHGNQARAMSGFEAYLASGEGSVYERARVRLQQGQALLDAGRASDAERHLLALADQAIPPRIAAEAMYQAGRAQHRQGRSEQARRTFARTAERFPGQDGTARALYLLADLQHDDLELEAARSNYQRAAAAAPTSNEAGLALTRLGGLKYLAEDYEGAAAAFEEYRSLHPDGRRISQATYWAARSYLSAVRGADAIPLLREVRRRDPLSYYGIRAGEVQGEPALAIPMEPSPPRRERLDSLVRHSLRRVDVLDELGRRSDLVDEVEHLRDQFAREDGGDYALAEALNERGYTLMALSLGWDIFRREGAWNPRLLRVIYPFPFQDLVVPESAALLVDPYLVAAVIRRESAFNPTVTSSAGAIGLMQIMPQTGHGLARRAGVANFTTEMLSEPDLNVRLGVTYLASLMDQFAADIPLVLAAYNAGPSRARRWKAFPEARDPELLMERIPFNETRDYVRHVKLNRALYRELYPDADIQVSTVDR